MSRAVPTPSPPAARSIPITRSRYVAGSLTVTPAPLTITADNQTKVYGAALPTLTASYSGFVNGDTSASLTTQPTPEHDGHRQQPVRRQPYPITASGAVDSDYTISYVTGTLTVTPVALDDHRQQPDQGLRRGAADADGQLLRLRQWRHLGQPGHAAHAQHDRHSGQRCRAPTPSPPAAPSDTDYTISYVAGTLTVTPATLTVTADDLTTPSG